MLPPYTKPYFWSWNFEKLNPDKDRKLIVDQILNWGDKKATDWLFFFYGKEEVKNIASTIPTGGWDKKSLNYWKIILGFDTKTKEEIMNENE